MTSLVLLILLLAVYVAGFFVAWVVLTRSYYRKYGCPTNAEVVEGALVLFLGALIWPMMLAAYLVGHGVRRFS